MTNFNRAGLVLRQTLNQLLLVPLVNRQLALEVSAFAASPSRFCQTLAA